MRSRSTWCSASGPHTCSPGRSAPRSETCSRRIRPTVDWGWARQSPASCSSPSSSLSSCIWGSRCAASAPKPACSSPDPPRSTRSTSPSDAESSPCCAVGSQHGGRWPMALRVLTVEDEPEMADLLARGLRAEGYSVDVAGNGIDALTLARTGGYDIAVLDVMLPGMSGFEVCRWLRRQNDGLAIMLLTARDAVDDRVTGLDAGADDYLTK